MREIENITISLIFFYSPASLVKFSIIERIGIKIDTTIKPTIPPRKTINIGSKAAVNEATAVSTSSS